MKVLAHGAAPHGSVQTYLGQVVSSLPRLEGPHGAGLDLGDLLA